MSTSADVHRSALFTPLTIGPLTLRNRIIKAATNEGSSRDGLPTKNLVRIHEAVAAGGAGMTTVAYCAVNEDGRTLPGQLLLNEACVPHLRVLTETVQAQGAAASAQITHGGCFTFLPPQHSRFPLSSSGGFNKVGILSGMLRKQAMSQADMRQVADDFVRAARLAREAGFNAVELHMGHGYLLSQFISPLYNKRGDDYGRTLENRLRFPAEVLGRVLDAVGKELAVVCKFSITEGVRRGHNAEHGAQIAARLEREGAHMLVLSAGMNVESMPTMFGNTFSKENRVDTGKPLVTAAVFLKSLMEPKVDFRELYLLEHARKVRQAVGLPLAYIGGAKSLAGLEQVLGEGFDAVAMGRVLIAEPDYPNKLQQGLSRDSICTACNRCVVTMYSPGGTSCVLGAPGDAQLNSQYAAG
ncbi:NADH:flavin oxidoreductase [Pseudomonas sp. TTU2014-080ASC]|uniref:NADH:flavin oxidoreductase n=1 Tax=Pseudomonas sp. TTU2014-080ASC TaxID=1729724 RepID=UPI000718982A|nr:NADH:flavin oxidoreductase [Pseudomonas sp. TTU2014-080ASC]KRW58446.1 flavin oxidoreductase [Pseudomonas sp. TTU2014-080ASC]